MPICSRDDFTLVANTIRCLTIDAVQSAKSGHPGLPMGMADVAAVLWLKFLQHDSKNEKWPDRDRFVLSGGHGSMLIYSLLHLAGYPLSMDELKRFRQFGSQTPGHPEVGHPVGVETTTGPLGQGLGNAVGMALAERMLAARVNAGKGFDPVDHRTFVFCGDGDLMEGVSHEALSLAGHLKLDRLVLFFDDNDITIEGRASLAYSDDNKKRFEAYGWRVLQVDGHDYDAIESAINEAINPDGRPTVIICRTTIGKGSPNMSDTSAVHGAPLGDDEIRLTKQALGFNPDEHFVVPARVREIFAAREAELSEIAADWGRSFAEWRRANPEQAVVWDRHMNGELPENLESALPVFDVDKPLATRSASGVVLNALVKVMPQLVGGSADLAPSTMTWLKDLAAVKPGDFSGSNLQFGVREHGMLAIINGMLLHGGFRVFGATFFVFADYCRPSLRLAALMGLPAIYVFTHDSFYVGEDGPTHEPVEQIASLRSIPGMTVIRPSDPTETAAAWVAALKNQSGPTALLLTRQNMKVIDRSEYPTADNLERGAYTLWQNGEGTPDLTLIATGSEVELALDAAKKLESNVRVVSMPSWELFEAQEQEYRDSVIDPSCERRLVIEAGVGFGWERYLGAKGDKITLDRFGASAPYKVLAEHFGFTLENVVEKACSLLSEHS